jgi:hypothetical protein
LCNKKKVVSLQTHSVHGLFYLLLTKKINVMKIELNSKLLQAINGLFLFAIAIVYMACHPGILIVKLSWLPGLFLLFGALTLAGASYLDKMDAKLATKAVLYFLYAILFFAVKGLSVDVFLIGLWAMIEAAILIQNALVMKKNAEKNWILPLAVGALIALLAYISYFVGMSIFVMIGVTFIFVALGQMLPLVYGYLPKIEFVKQNPAK